MTKQQTQKYSMFLAVFLLVSANILIWSTLIAFGTAFTNFKNKLIDIEDVDEKATKGLKGYAKDKKKKRTAMKDMAMWMKGAVQAYATANGNSILFDSVNFSPSKIMSGKSSTALARATAIYAAANDNVVALANYGILPADVADFLTAITDFETAISAPKEALAERKVAHAQLKQFINEADAMLLFEMDKLMDNFKDSAPTFYAQYFASRKITNIATHHTGIRLVILDADGHAIINAEIKAESPAHQYDFFSDVQGAATQYLHHDLYNLTILKEGYQPYTISNIDIGLGESPKLEVTLVPVI